MIDRELLAELLTLVVVGLVMLAAVGFVFLMLSVSR
jgi:hypothetical protein